MPNAKVIFERTLSDGLMAEVRIYTPPPDPPEPPLTGFKLQFVNDRAAAILPLNIPLRLMWELSGLEGDEMKINRKIVGVDDDFKPLLSSSKIPDDGVPTNFGERLNFRDTLPFTLEGPAT